ncbi:MAG: YciI family protein [Bacteroidia bacterium]
MKYLLILLMSLTGFAIAQNPNYDEELAKKLGADDYGMKNYIFVILKTGSNQSANKSFVDSCFKGHMSNMGVLIEQGKLIVAGPFGKNDKSYRGIFILNAKDFEEAQTILQSDPAIKENLLEAELYKWYGSAALPEYLKTVDKIQKSKF